MCVCVCVCVCVSVCVRVCVCVCVCVCCMIHPWMAYEQECATLGLFAMPGCCHGKISLEVRHDSQHLSVLKNNIAYP